MKLVVTQLVWFAWVLRPSTGTSLCLGARRPTSAGGAIDVVEEGSTICVAMIWWGVPFGLEAPDFEPNRWSDFPCVRVL